MDIAAPIGATLLKREEREQDRHDACDPKRPRRSCGPLFVPDVRPATSGGGGDWFLRACGEWEEERQR